MAALASAGERAVLEEEFKWLLREEVHTVLRQLQDILKEASHRFTLPVSGSEGSLKQENFILGSSKGQLELELKRERDRRSHFHHGIQENRSLHSQNRVSRKDAGNKLFEGDAQQKIPVKDEKSKVAHGLQEEQEQPSLGNSELCQLCLEESTRSKRKNICKNCSGVFCEDCSANELPLPSSINPECVCNLCHKHLIQQYSASPS